MTQRNATARHSRSVKESPTPPIWTSVMKPEIAERIRRPTPGGHVMAGSLPVISFGNPDTARVATISLNPSPIEFRNKRGWLLGERRRLHSLVSLERKDPGQLTDDEVVAVAEGCRDYFRGNWNKGWFGWLERLMVAAQIGSHVEGTACHLDLVQWATDPAMARLPRDEWARLVEDDLPFLRWQLDTSNVDVVLINGASVVKGVQQAGLVDGFETETLTNAQGNGSALQVSRAVSSGRLYLGWNKPVVGPMLPIQRQQLADWLGGQIADWTAPTAPPQVPLATASDYIAAGTTVPADALVPLLSEWAARSTASTIGDVGAFGGRALVTVTTTGGPFVLNADTKRAAVLEFLAQAGGGEVTFRVIANQRGRVNRVIFRADGDPTPGWYAYTTEERSQAGEL